MREIIELNQRVRAELPGNLHPMEAPLFYRESVEFWPEASAALKEAVENVRLEH